MIKESVANDGGSEQPSKCSSGTDHSSKPQPEDTVLITADSSPQSGKLAWETNAGSVIALSQLKSSAQTG